MYWCLILFIFLFHSHSELHPTHNCLQRSMKNVHQNIAHPLVQELPGPVTPDIIFLAYFTTTEAGKRWIFFFPSNRAKNLSLTKLFLDHVFQKKLGNFFLSNYSKNNQKGNKSTGDKMVILNLSYHLR